MAAFEGGPAATPLLVDVEGFVGQRVHHRPGDVGMAGGVGARCAVGDLAAGGRAALDGQEGGGDFVPAGIPFDAAALDCVLRLEHQRVLGFQAVVNRRGPREEVAHQVEHTVPHTGDIDPDVLHVEALAQFLDLGRLEGERVPAPGVLFQDPELSALLQRRGHHHTGRIVAGAAGVVADPHRGVVPMWTPKRCWPMQQKPSRRLTKWFRTWHLSWKDHKGQWHWEFSN